MSTAGLFIEPRRLKQVILNIINFQECMANKMLYVFCGVGNKDYHLNEIDTHTIQYLLSKLIQL